ncbi:MAG TPA: helix-turn-helix transcriptional regulator [Pseudonocardiaceae bacterium]|nr:helix-turn-helix transcriptional regulator [Pseudonocardiaceae bacterium]
MLGTQLRRLREARKVTVAAAGRAIHASAAKISRMELGRVGFRERDVLQLLTLYGVSAQQEREAFLTLLRRANVPGWWHQYSDIIPSWFEAYLGLEQASSVIRTYQPSLCLASCRHRRSLVPSLNWATQANRPTRSSARLRYG